MTRRCDKIALLLAAALTLGGPALLETRSALAGPIRSPHTAEACLDCHRGMLLKGNNVQGIPFIVLPEGDDPHRVLVNTCIGCHPKELPSFWLITFPRKKPPTAVATTSPSPSGKPSFANPHDGMECGKCHMNPVSFGELKGGEKELVEAGGDISDFCQKCHQDTAVRHFPRGNVPVGSTTCLTCHRVHHATSLSPSLRDDYYTFIRETREVNPHGGDIFCLVCHPSKPLTGEPPEFLFGGRELNRLCVRCHSGPAHHVMDKPPSETTWKMNFLNYPLQDGKIACVTCHNQHGGISRNEGGSTYSLRGEPYPRMIEFCKRCHEEKGWGKINPHDQITIEGEVVARSCLFCHLKVPDVAAQSASPADFNDTMTAVCTQCHENISHPEVNHLLLPSAGMIASMKAYEALREVSLPLDFDGRITCVTCHNPHEKGLFSGPDSVGADEEHRLRLTTFNEICTPCHGRH